MLRPLNPVHIALILVLPVVLALINPNWLFNLSMSHDYIIMVDDYIYTGYQLALPHYVGWYPSSGHYFIERIAWILPGYVLHNLFSPVIAHLILHFAVYYLATFSIYGVLNKLANARTAVVMTLLFGQYPLIMRSLGWNYPDGYAMSWLIVCILLMTYATSSRWRVVYLMGAGGAFMMMISAHFFNVFYAPAVVIYLLLLDRLYKKPVRLMTTGIFALIGAGIVYGIQAIYYYHLTGNVLFANALNTTQTMAQDLPYFLSYHFSGVPAYWHLFLIASFIIAIAGLFMRQNQLPLSIKQAVIGVFIGAYAVIIGWLLLGFLYTHVSFYHANIIMTAFLLLGITSYPYLTALPNQHFRYVLIGAFILPLLPFIFFSWIAPHTNFEGLYPLLVILIIGCIGAIVVMRHPVRVSYALIIFLVLCSIIIADSVLIKIYTPNRYEEQQIFEQAITIANVINQRHTAPSVETFRLWYDFDEPNRRVFHAVASIYLWGWARNAPVRYPPPPTFFQTREMIMMSSQWTTDELLQMANVATNNSAYIVVLDEEVVPTPFGDVQLVFVMANLSLFNYDRLGYYFSDRQQQFVIEETGWNGYEQTVHLHPFRWTSAPTAHLVLDIADAQFILDQSYRVWFEGIALEEAVVASLSLSINGEHIPLTREGSRFTGEIDGALLMTPRLELVFQTERVSNPFDLGIQDGRSLGVALSEFIIEPFGNDD